MKNTRKNWIVTTYDKYDKVISEWIIKNRTEHEAEHEAIADLNNCYDWSLIEVNK